MDDPVRITCQSLENIIWSPANQCTFSLADNEVDVWLKEIDIDSAQIVQYQALLSETERKRAHKYTDQNSWWRFITSTATLRMLIGQYLKLLPKNILISRDEHNKPYLSAYPDFHFNIAHSGKYILLAFSGTPLGVDIEEMNPVSHLQHILQDQFSDEERAYVNRSADPLKSFYTLWTRKEALLKATGSGFLHGVADTPTSDSEHSNHVGLTHIIWQISSFVLYNDYRAAVASANPSRFNFWHYPSSKKT